MKARDTYLPSRKGFGHQSSVIVKKVFCLTCCRVVGKATSRDPEVLPRKCKKIAYEHQNKTGHKDFRFT